MDALNIGETLKLLKNQPGCSDDGAATRTRNRELRLLLYYYEQQSINRSLLVQPTCCAVLRVSQRWVDRLGCWVVARVVSLDGSRGCCWLLFLQIALIIIVENVLQYFVFLLLLVVVYVVLVVSIPAVLSVCVSSKDETAEKSNKEGEGLLDAARLIGTPGCIGKSLGLWAGSGGPAACFPSN